MYYVTTPIYYVNDRPHIGHCYTTLLADVAARFARLIEGPDARDNVFFLTGTDEHAEKVVISAREHDMSPQAWADFNAGEFRKAFETMGFSHDDFVRTSEDRHKDKASAYIQRLIDSGDIELGDYEGWYDPSQEEYITETVAKEHDFKSPVTGRPLEKRVEQNYFFRLDKYESWLRERIENDTIRVLPEARKNEVLGRIRLGLQKVPVSRRVKEGDADWGILMPGDSEHRVYVWIEALCNYLTTVDTPERRRFWPEEEQQSEERKAKIGDGGEGSCAAPTIVHMMAKDILWFHAVIWPCLLHALGERPPSVVYAHGYWIREGRKMSKSLGNFIEIELLEAYIERYSVDGMRWYLATQGPMGANDADFAHKHFVETYNADLANGIGNSVSRVGKMIGKYFDGVVPTPASPREGLTDREIFDDAFLLPDVSAGCSKITQEKLDKLRLNEALAGGTSLATAVDHFINEQRPFSVAKDEPEEKSNYGIPNRVLLGTILFHCAEALRIASLLLYPACPGKMAEIWRNWNCSPLNDPDDPDSGFKAPLEELAKWGGDWSLKPGQRIEKGAALFMRADVKEDPPVAKSTE